MAATFKNPNVSSSAEETPEEAEYYNVTVCTGKKLEDTSDQKSSSTSCVLSVAVCWLTLLAIIILRIYFTAVIAEDNMRLTAELHNLQMKNQQLEKNLTDLLQNKETAWKELNISRSQWTFDVYCRRNYRGQCHGCQSGWEIYQSNCYVVINPEPSKQGSWEEAQDDCTEKISNLVVVVDEAEKTFVSNHSWVIRGNDGYWLGLRVEDGKWKWVDGSDLTDLSWIQQLPAAEGQCAVSVQNEGWKSVNCTEKKPWICKKKVLTL
ncbi:CD209 antigen-like protein C [Parambassis ranga]|uniref:CD209 antigen-like protein C n=1 Tax=Parambassis ranga TaxID=210632 RepID=A0A6P7K3Z8_9TELE|nr:CD209 antigen-like protein C [Parambassis ranga]